VDGKPRRFVEKKKPRTLKKNFRQGIRTAYVRTRTFQTRAAYNYIGPFRIFWFSVSGDLYDIAGPYPIRPGSGSAVHKNRLCTEKPVQGRKGDFRQGFTQYPVKAAPGIVIGCGKGHRRSIAENPGKIIKFGAARNAYPVDQHLGNVLPYT
jgi:hypothetical protein